MVAMPEVAMTLALLGTRLRRVGMMASAAWSNRLPSTNDRWLVTGERSRQSVINKCSVTPEEQEENIPAHYDEQKNKTDVVYLALGLAFMLSICTAM